MKGQNKSVIHRLRFRSHLVSILMKTYIYYRMGCLFIVILDLHPLLVILFCSKRGLCIISIH